MRAVIFKGVHEVAVEDRPKPKILAPTDAILKVKVAALRGSDLHWYHGAQKIPTGFVPGHEFVEVVEEVGDQVDTVKVGDIVVATFSTQCGQYFYCKKGQTSRCSKSYLFGNSAGTTSIDGGQAYLEVPEEPPSRRSKENECRSGMLRTGRNLRYRCALTWCDTVFAIDLVPERLAKAERLGAKLLILADDPESKVKDATDSRDIDVALEVVSSPDSLQLCLDMVRAFGCISSVGVQTQTLSLDGPSLYAKNVMIAWGRCPIRGIFEEALACLGQVQDMVSFLCHHTMRLEDAVEAYAMFAQRKVHKVLLAP